MYNSSRKFMEQWIGRETQCSIRDDSIESNKDVNCQLEVAVALSVSAKNCLKNVYGFSPNQLVFGRNPNYLNNFDNELPALEH